MGLDSAVSLIVAISELKAVRAVTRAFNANLPKDGPLGTIRPSSAQLYARPRQYYSPANEPRVEPRNVVQPSPTFAPSFDHYNRFGIVRVGGCADSSDITAWRMDGPDRPSKCGPFEAPWKHLPAVVRPVVQLKVNIVRPKVDLITKGTLLDLFV